VNGRIKKKFEVLKKYRGSFSHSVIRFSYSSCAFVLVGRGLTCCLYHCVEYEVSLRQVQSARVLFDLTSEYFMVKGR